MKYLKKIIKLIFFLEILDVVFNYIQLKAKSIKFSRMPVINGKLKVINKGVCSLGNNITINSGKNVNIIGGDTRCNIIIRPGGKLIVGDNVGISNSTIVTYDSVIISDDVLIGGGCKIFDTDFHSIDFQSRISPYINLGPDVGVKMAPVKIKSGAWIGGFSIILKGVTIGRNSVVGAGSVVTKSIPDNEVWGGNPARFIKALK